jgi:GTP cyclohydrolase II
VNPNQIKFLERLIANAQAERAMAVYVRDFERVSILTNRIEGYRSQIVCADMAEDARKEGMK